MSGEDCVLPPWQGLVWYSPLSLWSLCAELCGPGRVNGMKGEVALFCGREDMEVDLPQVSSSST